MQKVSLLCDNCLNFSLTREFERKEVHRRGFVTEAEKGEIEDIKAEKKWILKNYLFPFFENYTKRKDRKGFTEKLGIFLDEFKCISVVLKWGYQTGLKSRDIIYGDQDRGPLSLKMVSGKLSIDDTTRVFIREIINLVIPIEPYFLSKKFTADHIIVPFGVKTPSEELNSRLFVDIRLEKEHENLEKEAVVYLGVCSFTHMLRQELISLKELKDRVSVWPDGLPFRWFQGSSGYPEECSLAGKVHLKTKGFVLLFFSSLKIRKKVPQKDRTLSLKRPGSGKLTSLAGMRSVGRHFWRSLGFLLLG